MTSTRSFDFYPGIPQLLPGSPVTSTREFCNFYWGVMQLLPGSPATSTQKDLQLLPGSPPTSTGEAGNFYPEEVFLSNLNHLVVLPKSKPSVEVLIHQMKI